MEKNKITLAHNSYGPGKPNQTNTTEYNAQTQVRALISNVIGQRGFHLLIFRAPSVPNFSNYKVLKISSNISSKINVSKGSHFSLGI